MVNIVMDDWLYQWKIVSIVLTGFFGVLGLLTEFKDNETKKITRWGIFSLFGIIVSTIGGCYAQSIESSNAERDRLRATEQSLAIQKSNLELLKNIDRTLHPIGETGVFYQAAIRCELPTMEEFCREMFKGASSYLDRFTDTTQSFDNGKVSFPMPRSMTKASTGPYPILLDVMPGASIRKHSPNGELHNGLLIISFYKNQLAASTCQLNASTTKPDLEIWFTRSVNYQLDLTNKKLSALFYPLNVFRKISNGSIVSTLDMASTCVAVTDTQLPAETLIPLQLIIHANAQPIKVAPISALVEDKELQKKLHVFKLPDSL